jgi:hypothetical protein
MSAFDYQALDAIASQLVNTLERYEADTDALVRGWPDMDRYRTVSEQIDQIRLYCTGLPTVSVQFVGLLIAHAELIHCLWKKTNSPAASNEIGSALDQHRNGIADLRAKAERLLGTPAQRH